MKRWYVVAVIAVVVIVIIARAAASDDTNDGPALRRRKLRIVRASDQFPDCREDKVGVCGPVCGYGTISAPDGAILGGSDANGYVQLLKTPAGPDSKWQLIPHANGNFYLCDMNNNCLSADLAVRNEWAYHGKTSLFNPQGRWKITPAPGGYTIASERWLTDASPLYLTATFPTPRLRPLGYGTDPQVWAIQSNACLPPPLKPEVPTACPGDVKSCMKCTSYGQICDPAGECLGPGADGRAVAATGAATDDSKWQLLPTAEGGYFVCNRKDNCLVAPDDNGVFVRQPQVGAPEARWNVSGIGGDKYLLCNPKLGKCLSVGAGGATRLEDVQTGRGLVWGLPQCDRKKS